jgi:hypothetical protein
VLTDVVVTAEYWLSMDDASPAVVAVFDGRSFSTDATIVRTVTAATTTYVG